jgi:hypothetical protein
MFVDFLLLSRYGMKFREIRIHPITLMLKNSVFSESFCKDASSGAHRHELHDPHPMDSGRTAEICAAWSELR